MSDNIDYNQINTWPFQEARKILSRIGNKVPDKGYVLFETGYGASGLPHIGTFGEVAKTSIGRIVWGLVLYQVFKPLRLYCSGICKKNCWQNQHKKS